MLIKDKKIASISGPVSFALLKPKKFIFDDLKKEGVHLPIFMLFGDYHFSDDFQCENCSCNLEDRSCCMPVYSEEFLRFIDSMATKEYPIDFGIEGFNLEDDRMRYKYFGEKSAEWDKEYGLLKKGSIPKLRESITACYQRELRGSKLYEKYCPTKNIRWHYMDPRQAGESKYNLEYLLWQLGFLEEKIFGINYKKEDKKQLKKDIEEIKKKFPSEEMWRFVTNLKKQLVIDPKSGIYSYFKVGEKYNNSLVLKQFNKLSKSFKDLPFWKQALSDYIIYVLKEKRERYAELFSNNYLEEMDSSRAKYYSLLFNYDIEGIFEFINGEHNNMLGATLNVTENAIFLDLYYIFRTFKIPKGDKNPFLSISLFGDAHSRNIKYFLTEIIKFYEVVEDVKVKDEDKPDLRCTYMPNINFNELALEYGVEIIKPSVKPYVAPYVAPVVKPYVAPYVAPVVKPYVAPYVAPVVKPYVAPYVPPVVKPYVAPYVAPYVPPVVKPYVAPYVKPSRGSRRAPARRAPARKTSARRAPARKTAARRSPARRSPARRSPARKAPARRSPARRSPVRRAPAKRSPARRRK